MRMTIGFKTALMSGAVLCGVVPAMAQDATSTAPEAAATEAAGTGAALGDIVVTARRRDERLQDVPVSVTAFSAAALQRSTVQQLTDIRTLTPGFTFTSEGGKDNFNVTLRGIGQIPLGEGTPGVVTYVNNVAIPSEGSNLPTYDMASIQVLKGPQGTLFGKNTLGGAVLVGTQAPNYRFGGYVQGTYGRFDYREVQGALNIPIVEDKVALRVAGQIRRQDPRTKALDGGPGFDNTHSDAARVSLLLEPFEGLKSTTIADYYKSDELAAGLYLLRQNFPFSAFFGSSLGPVLDAQVQNYLAIQHANPRGSFDDGVNGGGARLNQKSITNDTSYSFGAFTLRNIFGYRVSKSFQSINTGAVGALSLPVAPGVNVPFTLFHASSLTDRQYLTNETQFLGNFDRFNFIIGFYYNNDRPHGPTGSQFTAFSVGGVPAPAVTSHVVNRNEAVYAQVGYKLTDALTLNVGGRYSWDHVSACGGEVAGVAQYATYSECRSIAALGLPEGVGTVSNHDKEPSYTIDLDWKVTPNWMLYAQHRRGYRGANVNTPIFETRFTTGGTDPLCNPNGTIPGLAIGQCPDLRPFQKTGVEKLFDFEIGSKLSFELGGARGHWNVAAYRDTYKNVLQFLNTQTIVPNGTPDSPNRGSVGINIGSETIWGVETEFSVSPTDNFTVSFNGAYTHVKIDSLSQVSSPGLSIDISDVNKFSPSFAGSVSASWTLPFHPADGDLILNGDLFMTADFGGQGGEKLPGYKLANFRLDWKHIGGTGIDLGFFLQNAFNEFYFASTSVQLKTFPISSEYLGAPRTWGISARYNF